MTCDYNNPVTGISHYFHALISYFAFLDFAVQFASGKKIQRFEHSTSKCCPNSTMPQNNVAHGGIVSGKQRVKFKYCMIVLWYRKYARRLYENILYSYVRYMHYNNPVSWLPHEWSGATRFSNGGGCKWG